VFPYHQSDRETVIEDARSSEGKSPRQRMAMFIDLLETIDVIWGNLTPEERRRRMEMSRQLDDAVQQELERLIADYGTVDGPVL
jgi:hypothetical protein